MAKPPRSVADRSAYAPSSFPIGVRAPPTMTDPDRDALDYLAITLSHPVGIILVGVVILTTGLFIGHAVASTLVGARATTARAQATALYNISYYTGSSVFGWIGGVAWLVAGWPGVASLVIVLATAAALLTIRATSWTRQPDVRIAYVSA